MEKTFAAICRSLSGHMLNNAFALLRSWIVELSKDGQTGLSDRFQSLEKNYQIMVDYYLSGEEDPQRSEITQSLIRESLVLTDEAYLEMRLRTLHTYEVRQMLDFQTNPLSPNVPNEDDIDGPPQVFRFFWLCKHIEEFDLDVLEQYIANEKMEEEAMLGISGLMLNILRSFSETGILFLIRICGGHYQPQVQERAWVALMLTMMHYDQRLRFFPSITTAFLDLIATEEGVAYALAAFSSLVRTSGVEWAGKSYDILQNSLTSFINNKLPSLKKDGQNYVNISIEDLDDFGKGLSDDLRSMMDKRGKELLKLREQHLDANFAVYRGMYTTSFFSDPFHWWLPFDMDYLTNDRERELANELADCFPSDICDSDRFAMITAMATFTGTGGLPAGLMPEVAKKQPQLICNAYMQQTYRFFVLNPWGICNTLFNEVSNLPESYLLKMLRPSSQDKIRVADQFLACHAYGSALQIYFIYTEAVNSRDTWRNYGLCLQKTGLYREAVQAYDHITINKLTKPNEWILRQKVWCLMQGDFPAYDEACQVLDQLLAFRPDDAGYIYEKGKCLERLELYMEALELYYKLDILQPRNRQVMRSIAWCSFISGLSEQARSYYEKLMAMPNPPMIDYLNYGHFLFVSGERMAAFHYYQQAVMLSDNIQSFLKVFRPDRRILLENGIPTPDIYLMEDQLVAFSRSRG